MQSLSKSTFLKLTMIGLVLISSIKEIKAQVNSFEIDNSIKLKKEMPRALDSIYNADQLSSIKLFKDEMTSASYIYLIHN